MRFAVAVEILLMAPIRVANLASMDFEVNFGPIENSTGEQQVSFAPGEVKTGVPLTFVLRKESVAIMNLYRNRFRPLLVRRPTSALFPGYEGGAMDSHALSRSIKDGIRRELGLTMNAHLFRHHAAFRYLKKNPGDYESVREFLAHKNIETTVKFYAGTDVTQSFRRLDEIVAKDRESEL